MKKMLMLLSLVALFAATGCKKDSGDSNSATLNNQDMIGQIFAAGMQWNTSPRLKSSIPVNITVDNTIQGPEGGTIHVIGSVTGSMNINDQTGAILGGLLSLGLTETINDYAFKSNGNTYTMSGAPYISLTGTFTMLEGGQNFASNSSMQIGGGVRVTGPGVDKTVNINITINLNTSGTGGHVSGTIDGAHIDYTF
jgi:hypothetical protein